MNEQVISIFDAIFEKFGIAVDWTQENILPYVQELCGKYIRYEIFTSIAWCVVFVLLTAITFLIANKFHKKALALSRPYDDDYLVSWIAGTAWAFVAIFSVLGIIVIFNQVFDIVTCLTFPEKMIFEFASSLTKQR